MDNFQPPSSSLHRSVAGYQLTNATAIHIFHLREIEKNISSVLFYQLVYSLLQNKPLSSPDQFSF